MSAAVIDLSVGQLCLTYISVLLVLLLFKIRGISRERQMVVACLRMTIQLTLMGYILLYVFENPSWYVTVGIVLVMLSFAIYNAIRRIKHPLTKELKLLIGISICTGSILFAVFFIIVVLLVRPWYHPQYFIPITGMVVGNAMTGISLGANKLCSDMIEKRAELQNSLMLGATPAMAAHSIVNDAFDSAILPTLNNMLTMGIVSLPGMMTGQILSGAFPLTAIKYQIGIMLTILGSTSLAIILFVTLGYRTFFTRDQRIKMDLS